MSKDNFPLLWIDLETTGLDRKRDYLLEVACFVTTPTGERDEASVRTWTIQPDDIYWERKMIPFVQEMHRGSGLTDAVLNEGLLQEQWWSEFEIYLDYMAGDHGNTFTVAGSGVGPFDLPWLLENFPDFATAVTYYVLDVGVIGRFIRNSLQIELPDRPDVSHRALSDIEDHWQEFLEYKELLTP